MHHLDLRAGVGQPVRHVRAGEAPGAGHDAGDAQPGAGAVHDVLVVDLPAAPRLRPHPVHAQSEADPLGDAEVLRVGDELRPDVLGAREQGPGGGHRQLTEARHGAARVRAHPGPGRGVRRARVPLPAEPAGLLEHDGFEPGPQQLLGDDDAGRSAADDGDAIPRVQRGGDVHGATVPDAAPRVSSEIPTRP